MAGSEGGEGFAQPFTGNGEADDGSLTYKDENGRKLATSGNHIFTTTNGEGLYRRLKTKDRPAGMLDAHGKFGAGNSHVYVAFLVSLETGSVNSFGDYGGLSLFNSRSEELFIGDPGFDGSNTFWGIDPHEGPEKVQSSGIAVDSTVRLLVTRIDFAAAGATVRLYIDPDLSAEPQKATVGPIDMHSFRFDRIRIQGGGNGSYSFDELALGTEYKDVVKIAKPKLVQR